MAALRFSVSVSRSDLVEERGNICVCRSSRFLTPKLGMVTIFSCHTVRNNVDMINPPYRKLGILNQAIWFLYVR